jgi:glycosyltransferase involved in cell wall biosynthesis
MFYMEPHPVAYYTFLYKLPLSQLSTCIERFKEAVVLTRSGICIETLIPILFQPALKQAALIRSLGVEGTVAHSGAHFTEFDWEVYQASHEDVLLSHIAYRGLQKHHQQQQQQQGSAEQRITTSNKPRVMCISHCFVGGTYTYYKMLQQAMPGCLFLYYHTLEQITHCDLARVRAVHVFSLHNTDISLAALELVLGRARSMSIPVYITLHDFQWILPRSPTPSMPELQAAATAATPLLSPMEAVHTHNIFWHAKQVFMPSQHVRQWYLECTQQPSQEHLHRLLQTKGIVTGNPDYHSIIMHENLVVPPAIGEGSHRTINIAFVGYFCKHKGAHRFLQLAETLGDSIKLACCGECKIAYHMFGGVVHDRSLLDHKAFANCIMHGRYEDGMLAELLHQHHIHIVAFLGDWMETYGYCLSRIISAGTPIVYRNMGCFKERLSAAAAAAAGSSRYFGIDDDTADATSVAAATMAAVHFVTQHQGTTRKYNPQPNNTAATLTAGYADYMVDIMATSVTV